MSRRNLFFKPESWLLSSTPFQIFAWHSITLIPADFAPLINIRIRGFPVSYVPQKTTAPFSSELTIFLASYFFLYFKNLPIEFLQQYSVNIYQVRQMIGNCFLGTPICSKVVNENQEIFKENHWEK